MLNPVRLYHIYTTHKKEMNKSGKQGEKIWPRRSQLQY
uniref:Uncharacterized protein n=1 Tax=Arundo donax TaxID=35708 RepID=A0A0A9FSR8_ARUDO